MIRRVYPYLELLEGVWPKTKEMGNLHPRRVVAQQKGPVSEEENRFAYQNDIISLDNINLGYLGLEDQPMFCREGVLRYVRPNLIIPARPANSRISVLDSSQILRARRSTSSSFFCEAPADPRGNR